MNSHMTRTRFVIAALATAAFLSPLGAHGQQPASSDVFDPFFRFGDTAHKVYAQEAPGETVDPFTGTLRVVQEDLVLPGRGGLDLHVVRTYSSKIWSRSDLLDASPLLAEAAHSVLGYGWSFHMGRLLNPDAIPPSVACSSGEFPVFEGPDGETRVFYPVPSDAGNRVFRSKDHWRLETQCSALGPANSGACVWSASGIRYELSSAAGNPYFEGTRLVWPVSAIVDANGNRISVAYHAQTGAVDSIVDSYDRTITFSYQPGDDGLRLDAMTANGKTYAYRYTTVTSAETAGEGRMALPGSRRFLTEVVPPAGGSYRYDYATTAKVAENQYALSKITYPHGGTTEYGYASVGFFTGRETVSFPVVISRRLGGRRLVGGTWTYAYSAPPPNCALTLSCSIDPEKGERTNFNVTTVLRPDGRQDSYLMVGFGLVADAAVPDAKSGLYDNFAYAVGLTTEAARADRAEVERFVWRPDAAHPISPAPYGPASYGSSCGPYLVDAPSVLAPLLDLHVVHRDGAFYATEQRDWDAYGQPGTVIETGEQGAFGAPPKPEVRVTTWSYFSVETEGGATVNMVRGRPLAQHVCIEGECFDNAWTYDGPGHRRDRETLSGVTTWFGYDGSGDLSTVRNALGETLRLGDYWYGVPRSVDLNGAYQVAREGSWEGWIESETDGRQHTTRYAYDAIGRVLQVTPPGTSFPTTYDYAPDGQPDGQAARLVKGFYWKLSTLDGLGRVVETSDSEETSSRVEYDALGNVTFRSYPYGPGSDPAGELVASDGLGRPLVVLRGYRPSQPAATCDGDGACAVTFKYSMNCTLTTVQRKSNDATERWRCSTSYGDPQEARLASVEDPLGNIWQYAYTAAGKLASVTAPLAQGNRSFGYDANQFLRTETTGESGAVAFDRNAIGQPITRRDARGVLATYRHDDPLSRLTGISWRTADDVTRRYEMHLLKHVETPASGAFDYDHDEVDRVVAEAWTYRGVRYRTSYGFDEMGCGRSVTYPTGTQLTITCDGLNRPTGIWIQRAGEATPAPVVSAVRYHPSGQPVHCEYGNGVTTELSYDQHARLWMLDATSRGSRKVAGLYYGYDGAGNVLSFDNTAELLAGRRMTYDAADRLESVNAWAQPNPSTSYQYDELGNLKAKWGSGEVHYVTDPVTNRLAFSTGTAPRPVSLTWDAPGRLSESSDGASYAYDGEGRRIAKTDRSGTTVYHYDAAGRLIAETQPDGAKLRDYVYLGNKLVAVDGCVTAAPPAPCTERQWYHTDALGSVVARTDVGGDVTAQFDYQPFGERWDLPGLIAGVDGDRQYNGRVYDAGTGFHDYGARLYWPEIGRFVSADSYLGDPGNPASLNRYSYVWNNPYKYVDPSGNTTWPASGVVSSKFGSQEKGLRTAPHNGIDIRNPSVSPWDGKDVADGTVVASDAGVVVRVDSNAKGGDQVVIRGKDGNIYGYAHTVSNAAPGDEVEEGQVIGFTNKSGHATGPHLHYTLRKGSPGKPAKETDKVSDPEEHLKGATPYPDQNKASGAVTQSGGNPPAKSPQCGGD